MSRNTERAPHPLALAGWGTGCGALGTAAAGDRADHPQWVLAGDCLFRLLYQLGVDRKPHDGELEDDGDLHCPLLPELSEKLPPMLNRNGCTV